MVLKEKQYLNVLIYEAWTLLLLFFLEPVSENNTILSWQMKYVSFFPFWQFSVHYIRVYVIKHSRDISAREFL